MSTFGGHTGRSPLESVKRAVFGTPAVYSTGLINELLELEKIDRHWEVAFRRKFLASKEDELRAIEKSFKFNVTQWELNAMLVGAFLMQALYGILTFSPLSFIISFFAMSLLFQLRLHRDKLTLHYSLLSFGGYIIMMANLLIVQPEHVVNYAGITAIFGISFIHAIIMIVLGRHTMGHAFERFAESCLQFAIPSLLEVQSLVIGVIIFLGICFSIVKLHYLSYTAFIVVLFTIIARFNLRVPRSDVREHVNMFEASLPVVRSMIHVLFTAAALFVCIASLCDYRFMSISNQESFKNWERAHGRVGDYTLVAKGLAYLLSGCCLFIMIVGIMLLLRRMTGSSRLSHALEHSTTFMGKACMSHKKEVRYEYRAYTLDRSGRVVFVQTMHKSAINGYNRSTMNCYDVYFAMQVRALHAMDYRSLYCYAPVGRLYHTDRDSNALVRGRVSLERMATRLESLVTAERKRRHDERRERERLRKLRESEECRPPFISTSIPAGVELYIPSIPRDSIRQAGDEVRCRKRSMSIPAELSLSSVDELPLVSRHLERMYNRRCVTTAIGDDFYWRRHGIIDRIRSSWLERTTPESVPSFSGLKPTSTRVYRDPGNGAFNFDKIDEALANIFRGLEIMNETGLPDFKPLTTSPSPKELRKEYDHTDNEDISELEPTPMDGNFINMDYGNDLCYYGDAPGVTIDIGEDSPCNNQESTPSILCDMRSVHDQSPINTFIQQPVQYIDLGTTKSMLHDTDLKYPGNPVIDQSSPMPSTGKWQWLDNALNGELPGKGGQVPSMNRQLSTDTAEQHRIRPIEEILQGEYYIDENGKLVVKNDSRYLHVPERYRGIRNVRNLAQYFDGRHQLAERARESDSDSTPLRKDLAKVVTSPVHRLMMITTGSNDTYEEVEPCARPAKQIVLPEFLDVEDIQMDPSPSSKPFTKAMPFSGGSSVVRPNVMITRQYEVHKPFGLDTISECISNSQKSIDDIPRDGSQEAPVAGEASEQNTHRELSVGSSNASGSTIGQLSPRSLRRLAAARHLPLALDSRQDRVFSICPQPRREGAVVPSDAQVNSTDTPSGKQQHGKNNGSSGCDHGNGRLVSTVESVASPDSSLGSLSASLTPNRAVTPRQNWRNEFDFSPVAVHSGMDVLMELMEDVAIDDTMADDQSSVVSHDFIFGR
ncbi:putative integral membrane protein [Babesia bovis T2Bo]|uniref:Uncharacterized protein n=1 Tax=Babesia bovis TaxID=5865 RepID=A7AMQ5_BABBO|nr:putative integral membrane protein [Babesia bovis T2Bo]EDO07839.1 putative integral membrane protein [Babesia bovis T2Bo]|eukprot:XP_001611407.1 hypothetical protein [Babesia bovis T2Bo]